MANRQEYATIEIPIMLRDRLAGNRLHARQGYHELVEAMLDFWEDHGGYDPGRRPLG